jgi:Fe-S cluster assembly protein SufD
MFLHITTPEQAKVTIDQPTRVVIFIHNYSGEVHVNVAAEGAEAYIFGLYLGRDSKVLTLKTTQKHSVGGSMSSLLIKSILFDQSKLLYEGLIRIEPQAQLSNAYQKNQNLLMSPDAYVDSRPFLEIQADDVRCTHGSTTGNLNQDQLLYIQDRGLSPDQAQRLLLNGGVASLFQEMNKQLSRKELGASRALEEACLEALM